MRVRNLLYPLFTFSALFLFLSHYLSLSPTANSVFSLSLISISLSLHLRYFFYLLFSWSFTLYLSFTVSFPDSLFFWLSLSSPFYYSSLSVSIHPNRLNYRVSKRCVPKLHRPMTSAQDNPARLLLLHLPLLSLSSPSPSPLFPLYLAQLHGAALF